MTLRVMKSDIYNSGEGRRICVMFSNAYSDEKSMCEAYIDRFGMYTAKSADVWEFSFYHPDWEWIERLLPIQVRDDIDSIAHDMPGKPHTYTYSFEYHANYT